MFKKHSQKIVVVFLILSLIAMIMCISSCASTEKIAARKAAKEEKARQEEMVMLQKVREQLPCDPVKIIQGKTIYLPGDSVPCPGAKPGDTIWMKCPPQGIRVDTFIKLDQAALKAARDSALSAGFEAFQLRDAVLDLNKENASLRADNASLKKFKTWIIVILSALFAGVVLFHFIKGRLI